MKRRVIVLTVLSVGLLLIAGAPQLAFGQEAATGSDKPELPGWTQAFLHYLNSVEKKTVQVAEDFPDELYNTYRSGDDPDVRTVAEVLLHVAFTNANVAFMSSTEEQKQAYAEAHNGPPSVLNFRFTSKADTVTKVRETFAAVRASIQANPNPDNAGIWYYAGFHSSEHFGQLMAYYRVNGLVPPTSRQ